MRVVSRDLEGARAVIDVSHDELVTLSNALNDVLHGFEVNEFGSRIGASKEEAEELLRALHALAKEYPRPSW